MTQSVTLLHLLQLADSALPVGAMAHSFGLESLVEYGALVPDNLESFLRDWLVESGTLEAVFCARSCALAQSGTASLLEWLQLNLRLDARKPAREAREASAAIARRLIDLATRAFGNHIFADVANVASAKNQPLHYAVCFGYMAGRLQILSCHVVPAFLHQNVAGLISACQRLMPLGHIQAQAILFHLKPEIACAAASALEAELHISSFAPLLEIGSMTHPRLGTRLFIS
ncbi:MAG TPA: urease accessory UreF family protein [Terriglobales bacterium]|nr:urease accessory UreF family protein [Terriglobales bacterium]